MGIIFDFDGVLADTLEDMLRFAGQVSAELGHPCQPSRSDLDALERMEFSEYGKQLGIPNEKINAFVSGCFELFSSKPAPPAIFPGMAEVVRKLSQSNRLVILTGNTSGVVQRFLQEHRLETCFGLVYGADFPGTRSDKLASIASSWHIVEERLYMVGDAVSDIRLARLHGVVSVAVAWGHQSETRLLNECPDWMAGRPEDLLEILV